MLLPGGGAGHPKGVVLSHSNLKYQIDNFVGVLKVTGVGYYLNISLSRDMSEQPAWVIYWWPNHELA